MNFKSFKRRFFKDKALVRVYSHPRSGTHFLEAFLARNFYKTINLHIGDVTWGHWSNRKIKPEGNPFGKLFGSHHFPDVINTDEPKIYIIRDGRAVAYSVWKTDNFKHKELKSIAFKDFLRTKIDWKGSPAFKSEPKFTIFEHWKNHVEHWIEYEKVQDNVLLVCYEELISDPYKVYLKIHGKYFNRKKIFKEEQLDPIKNPVGLLPNKATKDSWVDIFDEEDLEYYATIIPKGIFYQNSNYYRNKR